MEEGYVRDFKFYIMQVSCIPVYVFAYARLRSIQDTCRRRNLIKKIRGKDPDISIGNHRVSSSIWNKFAQVIEIAQAALAHAIPAF